MADRADKRDALYQGILENYNTDRQQKMYKDILYYIKDNGLTIDQATELLNDVLKSLTYYGTIISVADWEKMTGKTFNYSWIKSTPESETP